MCHNGNQQMICYSWPNLKLVQKFNLDAQIFALVSIISIVDGKSIKICKQKIAYCEDAISCRSEIGTKSNKYLFSKKHINISLCFLSISGLNNIYWQKHVNFVITDFEDIFQSGLQ